MAAAPLGTCEFAAVGAAEAPRAGARTITAARAVTGARVQAFAHFARHAEESTAAMADAVEAKAPAGSGTVVRAGSEFAAVACPTRLAFAEPDVEAAPMA